MTCTNIASLPYVVVLLTALLVRTLRPPGARVDTPYGPGRQVTRSAPPGTPIGTLVTAAQGGDLGVDGGQDRHLGAHRSRVRAGHRRRLGRLPAAPAGTPAAGPQSRTETESSRKPVGGVAVSRGLFAVLVGLLPVLLDAAPAKLGLAVMQPS